MCFPFPVCFSSIFLSCSFLLNFQICDFILFFSLPISISFQSCKYSSYQFTANSFAQLNLQKQKKKIHHFSFFPFPSQASTPPGLGPGGTHSPRRGSSPPTCIATKASTTTPSPSCSWLGDRRSTTTSRLPRRRRVSV